MTTWLALESPGRQVRQASGRIAWGGDLVWMWQHAVSWSLGQTAEKGASWLSTSTPFPTSFVWCMCVCVCIFMCVRCVCICSYGCVHASEVNTRCLFQSLSELFLRQGQSLNLELVNSASLAEQWTSWIFLSPPWGYRHEPLCLAFSMGIGDPNSRPCAPTTSTSLSGSSL